MQLSKPDLPENSNGRKVILFIAMSLDGYIAGPDDDLSFLNQVAKEDEDYGYSTFTDGVDTVIMGRKTYDWVMGQVADFPHAGKETYIITRTERASPGNLNFFTGNIAELIASLKLKPGKNIFVDGGAEVVNTMLQADLLDEMIISVIPVLLGKGTLLFKPDAPGHLLKLISCRSYETGLVQVHYKISLKEKNQLSN
jgi:dihydrofolate reductase